MSTAEELGAVAAEGADEVSVRVCPEGPLLVRGAETVLGPDGRPRAVTRPVVAVCGCGKSQRLPWCDSTHKSLRR